MTVERVDARFAELKRRNRAGFVAYVMAGDPDNETALDILRGLPAAGADLIELGFPFSDPMAEGPTIQLASQRALKGRMTLRGTLELVRRFRSPLSLDGRGVGGEGAGAAVDGSASQGAAAVGSEEACSLGRSSPKQSARTVIPDPSPVEGEGSAAVLVHHDEPIFRHNAEPVFTSHRQPAPAQPVADLTTPLILMGYLNPLLAYGYTRFARDAAEAGVDGLIVVDCPPEEADPLADALDAEGVALIRLATPTSDDARLEVVTRRTSGFVYYVSVAGVTGAKEADAAAVAPAVERVRRAARLPVAVGFGIKTPERAAEVARVADAVVVGSALVDEIAVALDTGEPAAPRVLAAAKMLADAVHGARVKQEVG